LRVYPPPGVLPMNQARNLRHAYSLASSIESTSAAATTG
jgi:hypothetical protein